MSSIVSGHVILSYKDPENRKVKVFFLWAIVFLFTKQSPIWVLTKTGPFICWAELDTYSEPPIAVGFEETSR